MIDEVHPFYKYYLKIYGDRWPALLSSLQEKELKVLRLNANSADFKNGLLVEKYSSFQKMELLDNCIFLPPLGDSQGVLPSRTSDGLLDGYVMDPASVLAARALEVKKNDRVLDMCAAPGGKALILAEALMGTGELIANELSAPRRERLQSVLRQYIPIADRESTWVKGKDGTKYGLQEPSSYDRILLDAPCSGERHLLQSPEHFKEWSESRGRNLAFRQYSLLASAWAALKDKGRLVYSTCSINPIENDEVVKKLVKKKKEAVTILRTRWGQEGELTDYGVQLFPDKCGFGPIYFSVLLKTEKAGFN